jgi:MSHA biogenesis protein MshL
MQKSFTTGALVGAALALGACSTAPTRDTYKEISAEVAAAAAQRAQPAPADAVSNALLPPVAQLADQLPKARAALDERFNVSFNNVPAQQFFNSIVAGTRYNILVNPDISGTISANLKDVTLFEALDAVRELYGYDYKVDGTRIYIRPLTMQTRMFQVNYLTASRRGSSNLRVTSTSVSDAVNNNGGGQNGSSGNNGGGNNNNSGNNNNGNNNNGGNNGDQSGNNGQQQQQRDSASVTTRSESDFWVELKKSLEAIVGTVDKESRGGRSVVISPQSGVIVIRALPEELRNVDQYLKATQLSVDRQVILEAKILEVQLNNSFQTGINWAAFGSRNNSRGTIGVVSPGTTLTPLSSTQTSLGGAGITATAGASIGSAATTTAGTLFGLAFQTSNFSALISFLETQGTVNVLSSPRIATLNNQKAVLKIGTDEFFVTGVTTTTNTNASGTGATTSPSVTLQPFFSGVVLDVTPQIDANGNIILHVHPSVSQVSTVTKEIDLGTAGNLTLPLASSNTSEIDSIVRGQDGKVVAIGGLMKQSSTSDNSQVPGAGNIPVLGALFRNTSDVTQKSELVVLIKPTIVEGASDWSEDLLDTSRRLKALDPIRASERK